MLPVYVTKGPIVAASSTGVGTVSTATTNSSAFTAGTLAIDTARRVTIWSTGATLASAKFTVVGTGQGGNTITETIVGPSSNVPVNTTSDFLTVTSITPSSLLANEAIAGTSSLAGTVWVPANVQIRTQIIGGALTFSSSANGLTAQFEYALDNPFTYGQNVPGTIAQPSNQVPTVFTSTAFTAASTNTAGAINNAGGLLIPISAWRMTLTSSSSQAGSVNATVIQAGIG